MRMVGRVVVQIVQIIQIVQMAACVQHVQRRSGSVRIVLAHRSMQIELGEREERFAAEVIAAHPQLAQLIHDPGGRALKESLLTGALLDRLTVYRTADGARLIDGELV